jgi:cephalosporin hydroxylase
MQMTIRDIIRRRLVEFKFHQSIMTVRRMRKFLMDWHPSLLLRLNRNKRIALIGEFRECSSVQDCIEFTKRHMAAGSCQIGWEIESAIKLIANARPRILCEIGTFDGGTSLLFSKFLTTVEVMLCIDLYVKNKDMIKLLAPPSRRLKFIDMPSYSCRAINKVEEFLKGQMIDVLFIDGDHRYEGVKQDFLCYRPFVRDGGLILFHDIIEDKGSGRAWVGGVPRLWRELSPIYPHHEFVHSRDQEGFGIGVLTYSRGGGAINERSTSFIP